MQFQTKYLMLSIFTILFGEISHASLFFYRPAAEPLADARGWGSAEPRLKITALVQSHARTKHRVTEGPRLPCCRLTALQCCHVSTSMFDRLKSIRSGTVCRSWSGRLRRCKFSAADWKPNFLSSLTDMTKNVSLHWLLLRDFTV